MAIVLIGLLALFIWLAYVGVMIIIGVGCTIMLIAAMGFMLLGDPEPIHKIYGVGLLALDFYAVMKINQKFFPEEPRSGP